MVLGKFPVLGRPTIWMIVGQGHIALAVGAGGGLFGHFYSPLSFLSSSPFLWGTARYRLKYCLKGPLNQKQTKKKWLKFQTLIAEILQYFLLKNCKKLLHCKSLSHFFNQKYRYISL